MSELTGLLSKNEQPKKTTISKLYCLMLATLIIFSVLLATKIPSNLKNHSTMTTAQNSEIIFVGSYTRTINELNLIGNGSGLYVFKVENCNLELLSLIGPNSIGNNPVFITTNPIEDLNVLYTVNAFGSDITGKLVSISYDPLNSYALELVNRVEILNGYNPSGISVNSDGSLIVVSLFLNGGGIALYGLDSETGKINDTQLLFHEFEASSDDLTSEIHSVQFVGNSKMIVVDYGLNSVYLVQIESDYESITILDTYEYSESYGPRSIAINGDTVYISLQTIGGFSVFTLNSDITSLSLVYTHLFDSTCQKVADIRNYGSSLGISCRGSSLSSDGRIVIVSLENDLTTINNITNVSSFGETPRSFDFINGNILVNGNQDSNTLAIEEMKNGNSDGELLCDYRVNSIAYVLRL